MKSFVFGWAQISKVRNGNYYRMHGRHLNKNVKPPFTGSGGGQLGVGEGGFWTKKITLRVLQKLD